MSRSKIWTRLKSSAHSHWLARCWPVDASQPSSAKKQKRGCESSFVAGLLEPWLDLSQLTDRLMLQSYNNYYMV